MQVQGHQRFTAFRCPRRSLDKETPQIRNSFATNSVHEASWRLFFVFIKGEAVDGFIACASVSASFSFSFQTFTFFVEYDSIMPTLTQSKTAPAKLKKQRRTPMPASFSLPLPKKISAPASASTATMLKFVALQQHQSQLLSWMGDADPTDYSFIR